MIEFKKELLYFIPLGGAGHFGCNLNLYIYNDQILIVDLGIGFPDDRHPGIELLFPDIQFLKKNKDKIKGLIITHAHEDHIGGVSYLWDQIGCPVFTTPFTACILKEKLKEKPWQHGVPINVIETSGSFFVGDFSCEFVHLTHSTPEQSGMFIRVPSYKKTLFHTGDWCLDDTPVVGKKSELDTLNKKAKEGVLLVVSDSTNALKKNTPMSELDVQNTLFDIFSDLKQRIVVTCFASNIARLQSILTVAKKHNRHVLMLGRSMKTMYRAAVEVGCIEPFNDFVSSEDAGYIPRDKILIVCTGTQGEPRSALSKIAFGEHPDIVLEKGDTVLYSSWVIPGNEKNVTSIKSEFIKKGIDIIDDLSLGIHASGHPNRNELEEMYHILYPDAVIPVHGEQLMMIENARIAKNCGVKETFCPQNGDVIEIVEDGQVLKKIDHIETKTLVLDGSLILDENSQSIHNRRRLSYAGCVTVSIVIDKKNNLCSKPVISSWGIIDDHDNEDALYDGLSEEIEENYMPSSSKVIIEDFVYRTVRRFFRKHIGKKPMTKIHIIDVNV